MSGPVRHFTDLEVWRQAHRLFLALVKDVDGFPPVRSAAALAEQLVRSSGSVGANVAEGFNRSRSRFLNCLDIALGEANELENWLYKARDAGFLPIDVAEARLRAVVEVEKMLTSLKRKIAARPDRVAEDGGEYTVWKDEG